MKSKDEKLHERIVRCVGNTWRCTSSIFSISRKPLLEFDDLNYLNTDYITREVEERFRELECCRWRELSKALQALTGLKESYSSIFFALSAKCWFFPVMFILSYHDLHTCFSFQFRINTIAIIEQIGHRQCEMTKELLLKLSILVKIMISFKRSFNRIYLLSAVIIPEFTRTW